MTAINFELIRLLTQVGLFASWGGLHDHSERILNGAAAWCPEVAQIRNCQGLALFAAGRNDEAVVRLTRAVEDFPADDMAKATLAFVLKQLDRPGWPLLAESVGRSMQSYEAVWLARHTLGLDPEPPDAAIGNATSLGGGLEH
jgi:hypothetical protein